MVDNELILRFLALEHRWSAYRPPLKRFLNDYMKTANAWDEEQLRAVAGMFDRAANGIVAAFTTGAYRLIDAQGEPIDRSINRALAEVQLTAFAWVTNTHEISQRKDFIVHELSALYRDQAFLDSVQRATGDCKRTHRRLGMFCESLVRSGLELSNTVPYEPDE
jgi:hypothetical protein